MHKMLIDVDNLYIFSVVVEPDICLHLIGMLIIIMLPAILSFLLVHWNWLTLAIWSYILYSCIRASTTEQVQV